MRCCIVRRGLLALLWSIVNILTFMAFLIALIFAILAKNSYYEEYSGEGEGEAEDEELNAEVAVTSRAMAFAALWTAVLASLMGLFGTVILGFQSPTGQYYTCCSAVCTEPRHWDWAPLLVLSSCLPT